MKASVLTKYGSPDFFEFKEVPKPTPGDDDVLVKVHASSINSWDWEILIAKPFINRMMAGLFKPSRIKILGCDIAGEVEAVGKSVKRFAPGDEVFGDLSHCKFGGFAEYVCVPEYANALAIKPPSMTFSQAAAIPQAAVLALQGLRQGKLGPEHSDSVKSVLINGASGGVGSFAVQMAKSFGAKVTGVCSTHKMDFVSSLGADHVIDYKLDDFTRSGRHFDLILDVKGYHSISDYRRVLSPDGIYVIVGGSMSLINQLMLLWPYYAVFGHRKMGLLLHHPDANDLEIVKTLFESGRVIPVIDKSYSLGAVAEAMHYFAEGWTQGKIVISVRK